MDKLYYDAFISYRHTELDSFVAQKVHKMLERYRIPKKVQEKSGKKKITRIFRDQEELPLSADLSENITTALEHSEFLILICSPEALESRWVRTEIETFLKTHSKDRILTVLVKGEPEEAFPEILCFREKVITENGVEKTIQVPIEPLAADVRGESKAEVEKKLKNEVLRILAPMLSCSYDELRQRHREYKLKCTIGIVSVILCLAIAFSVYAMRQAAAIEEQYQNSRMNQARYLCNISNDLLKSGDRAGALQTALALQTEDGKEALVPEQMYALNNALYSYQYDKEIYLNPDRKLEMENSVKTLYPEYAVTFSPKGTYILTVDILGTAAFFDSVTGELLFSVNADEYDPTGKESFLVGMPVSETEAVLLTDRTLFLFDIAEQKLLNSFPADPQEVFGVFYNPRCEAFGECLAVRDTDDLYVYNYKTGEILFERDRIIYEEVIDFEVSPSQKKLVCSVKRDEYGSDDNDFFKLEEYSLETGELTSWDIPGYEELKLSYVDEDHLALMWIPLSTSEQVLETYRTFCYGVYDLRGQTMLWQDEGFGVFADYSKFTLMTENMYRSWEVPEEEPMMIISITNQLKVVSAMTGELISHSEGKGDIVGVQKLDDTRLFLASENGEIYVNAVSVNGNLISTTKIDTELKAFYYHPDTKTGAVVLASDGQVALCRTFQDQSMTSAGVNAASIYYMSTEEREYRGITVSVGDSGKEQSAILWDLDTGEEVLRVKADTNSQKMELLVCLTLDGEDYLLYSLISKNYKTEPQQLQLVKISTGETIYQVTLENIPSHRGDYYQDRYDDDLLFAYSENSKMAVIYLKSENYFEILDCTTGKMVVPYREVNNKEEIGYSSLYAAVASDDGKYFIFTGKLNESSEKDSQCYLKLWNIEEQCWEQISGKETFIIEEGCNAEEIYTDNLLIGPESMQLVIYPEHDEVFVFDILTGKLTQKIPFHGKNRFRIKFFDDEKYLLMYGDEGHLMMWDLKEQKLAMKDTELLEYVTGIYTDESSRYFGLASNTGAYSHVFNIYYVDENSRFYHYADIQNGFARFSAEEAFNFGSNGQSYFTKFYDYETLKEKAEKVIGDNQLTDTERKMYYLAEE